MIYGYVLAGEGELEECRRTMAQLGIAEEDIYADVRRSRMGSVTTLQNRPAYADLMAGLKPGDMVYVRTLDDLGCGYEDILRQWIAVTRICRADIAVLDMPLLDTRWRKELLGSYVTDMFISVFSYISDKRRLAREHQKETIDRAKRSGKRVGAPPKPLPLNFRAVREDYVSGKISLREGARRCGMTHVTFKKKVADYGGPEGALGGDSL